MYYTKYRPQKFSEVAKPNDVVEALMQQVKNHKVGHAYLFVGPRGTGKTTTARILAKSLNCTNIQENGDPCDKCEACVSIREGRFIDLIEIDAASNRGIDDIRELRDRIKLAPSQGKRKVYIIDEVHMLTNEAFNALLKTLEEPPSHVNFILCTTEFHKVPETIKSRCQVFKFKRATVSQLTDKLSVIAKTEKAKVSKEDIRRISEASLGGFRDAETLLQQVIEGNLDAESVLDRSAPEEYLNLVDLLLNKQVSEALLLVNSVYERGIDMYVWTGELLKYLRDLLLISSGADGGIIDSTGDLYQTIKTQSERVSSSEIILYLDAFIKAQNQIKSTYIPQLPLELAVVSLCVSLDDSTKSIKATKPVKPAPVLQETKKKTESKVSEKPEQEEPEDKEEGEDIEEPDDDKEETEISEPAVIEISVIEENWKPILTKTKEVNSSIQALLKSGKPVSVEGSYLILEVMYAFHKERIESSKNRKIIEDILKEVLGTKMSIKCKVSAEKPKSLGENETGNLTDMNVVKPVVTPDNALDLFDGGLPVR